MEQMFRILFSDAFQVWSNKGIQKKMSLEHNVKENVDHNT